MKLKELLITIFSMHPGINKKITLRGGFKFLN